jgi:phosphoglycerol transferase
VSGLETLTPNLPDPKYLGPWGLQDDTLFGLAKEKLATLSAGTNPFALVMLTLDTHHPNGHANTNRACQNVTYGDGSNAMLTSVKCADRLAAEFIRSIRNSPMAEDTVIVVASDHVAMVNGAADQLSVRTHNQYMTVAAEAQAERNRMGQRSYRVAMRRQSLRRANMFSIW